MNRDRISKNIKLKIEGLGFSVTLETPLVVEASMPSSLKNLHYHVMYELFRAEDETITVYTDSTTTEYKNCFVCIPPFCRHRTIRKSGARILFAFDKTQKNETAFSRFMDSFFSKNTPFEIPSDEMSMLLYKELCSTLNSGDSLADEIASSLLKIIFHSIYKRNSASAKDSFSSNESYLVKIDDIINDFQKDITLQNLADTLHLSTKQTSRIIQKNYKKKLSEILVEKRLSVAAELLLRSNKTILEIVEYVNFPSERYFYAQFKKTFGCTPNKYRKKKALSNDIL